MANSNRLDFYIEQGSTFSKRLFIESGVSVTANNFNSVIESQNERKFEFDISTDSNNNSIRIYISKDNTANLSESKSKYQISYTNGITNEKTIMLKGIIYLNGRVE